MKKILIMITFIVLLSMGIVLVGSVGMCFADSEVKNTANCKAYYVIEAESGSVIESYNEDAAYPIASMVKIMTLLLTYEKLEKDGIDLTHKLVVSHAARSMGGSQMFLDENLEYTLSDLLLGVTIASANDASVALSEFVAGSEEGFVGMMNSRAKELNMTDTNFVNCTGLPKSGGFSSARDVAIMFKELIKHKDYFNYSTIWLKDFLHPDGRTTTLTNTNKLSRFYKGCDGGKTGYTAEAKYCLTATASRNGMRVIAVCIGADSSKERNAFVSKLFDTAFAKCKTTQFAKAEEILGECKVVNGNKQAIPYCTKNGITAVSMNNADDKLGVEYVLNEVKAPIKAGDIVGTAYLTRNGVVEKEIPLLACQDVDKATYFDSIQRVLAHW